MTITLGKPVLKKIAFCIGLFLLIFFEIFVITSNFPPFTITQLPGPPFPETAAPYLDILFSGNTFGTLDLYGCERVGSIARRATLIAKFPHYLYLDYGNFTGGNISFNKAAAPFLLEIMSYLRISALNLTKQDYINLKEAGIPIQGIPMVSANLDIHRNSADNRCLSPFIIIDSSLKNKTHSIPITIAITAITSDRRQLHRCTIPYAVKDMEQSLHKIKNRLEKADFTILLFNDSFFKLEELLARQSLRFHLVIASPTLPHHSDVMIQVHDTPVVFAQEFGRSLGHVRIQKKHHRLSVIFNSYLLGMGIPGDNYIKELINRMSDSFHSRDTASYSMTRGLFSRKTAPGPARDAIPPTKAFYYKHFLNLTDGDNR